MFAVGLAWPPSFPPPPTRPSTFGRHLLLCGNYFNAIPKTRLASRGPVLDQLKPEARCWSAASSRSSPVFGVCLCNCTSRNYKTFTTRHEGTRWKFSCKLNCTIVLLPSIGDSIDEWKIFLFVCSPFLTLKNILYVLHWHTSGNYRSKS